MDFDDKPFINLLDLLYPIIRKHPYFSNDFFTLAVELYLEKKVEVADDLDELLI